MARRAPSKAPKSAGRPAAKRLGSSKPARRTQSTPLDPRRSAPAAGLIDVDEALKLLRTSRPTLYRLVRSGRIKATKVGKQWRFLADDLQRYMAGQQPQVTLPTDITPLLAQLRQRLADAGIHVEPPRHADDGVSLAVDLLIHLAHVIGASDVHIEPLLSGRQRQAVVRCRVDGVLQQIAAFDLRLLEHVANRLKALAGCNVTDHDRPQDGRFQLNIDSHALDLRACFVPTPFAPSLTLRLLDRQAALPSLDRLDFHPQDRRKLDAALHQPWGLILLTGPTGCGKTTVLYACLNAITNPGIKILTVEDPVEYALDGVTQVQVRPQEGLTFASALRAFLRSDPDVILVGEIRDAQTLQLCLQAALVGHRVLSTLHAGDAAEALTHLRDMGLPPFQISSAVKLIAAQRLLRLLCPHCKRPCPPPISQVENLCQLAGLAPQRLNTTGFHEAVGCPRCAQTGYRGRTLITELLIPAPPISDALARNASAQELRAIAMQQGMTPLAADALRRAETGQTSLEEILRVLPPT